MEDNGFIQLKLDDLIPRKAPEDNGNIALIFFFLFGVSGWMAWDACIAALDYYQSRFSPQYNPSFVFGFVFNWPLFFANFLLLYITSWSAKNGWKTLSLSIRIYSAYIAILIISYSMPLIAEFLPKTTAWYLLLFAVMVNGVGNSFIQGGMFGLSSIFPRKYMTWMMVGQGINGMLLNSVKMLLLAILPPDESKKEKDMNSFYDSLIFLAVFSVILWGAIVAYNILMKMEFTQYYLMRSDVNDESIQKRMNVVRSLVWSNAELEVEYMSTVSLPFNYLTTVDFL
jgi:hypothetical protein